MIIALSFILNSLPMLLSASSYSDDFDFFTHLCLLLSSHSLPCSFLRPSQALVVVVVVLSLSSLLYDHVKSSPVCYLSMRMEIN